ncbi:hypothetical protein BX600DRAFT_399966 [Xylariales sp. PMI_506]|nr:hypothetical protein BX600DRAFT_399966 [Xylariales sp. PMI_506]
MPFRSLLKRHRKEDERPSAAPDKTDALSKAPVEDPEPKASEASFRTHNDTGGKQPSSPSNIPSPQSNPLVASAEHAAAQDGPEGDASQDPWAQAFRAARTREPGLMADFSKHLVDKKLAKCDAETLLLAPQNVESVVERLSREREQKQWHSLLGEDIKVREVTEKLVKFLLWSDEIIKSALSTQPYAALAWSAVSIILPLIGDSTAQHESMLEGLKLTSHIQIYWKICEDKYLRSSTDYRSQITKELVVLYSNIVEYQARVICHLSQSQLTRAWEKFSSKHEWSARGTEIEKLSQRCSQLIPHAESKQVQENWSRQLTEMNKSKEILDGIRQILVGLASQNVDTARDQRERDLLQDLSSNYESGKDFNPKKVPGTCEWLLKDERFTQWRDSKTSSLLWVSAGPGCGKSVLSRALIDEGHLSTSVTTSTVCYFFFKEGEERRMDSASALSAVLHQLFDNHNTSTLISHAIPAHKSFGSKLAQNMSELWRILTSCAKSEGAGEIVCILDALDECELASRRLLIEKLGEFYLKTSQQKTTAKLKILITSRPYDDIEASFQDFFSAATYLRFDGDDKHEEIKQEISLVIDAKVNGLARIWTPDDRRKISQRLKSTQDHSYLWLYLTFNIIENNRGGYARWNNVESLLSKLPTKVSDAYEDILTRCQNPEQASLLLQLVLVATHPLSLQEANLALTMAISEKRFDSHETLESNIWPAEAFKSVVRDLSGIISVHDSTLVFIHLTAREFLTAHTSRTQTESNSTIQRPTWQGRLDVASSHQTLASSCINYLLLSEFDSGDYVDGEDFQFFWYASMNWTYHYRAQGPELSKRSERDARELCRLSEVRTHNWRHYVTVADRIIQRDEDWSAWTDLMFAAYLGLATIVQYIIANERVDINAQGGRYRTALCAAAARGYPEVVQIFLENPERVDVAFYVLLIVAQEHERGEVTMALLLDSRGSEFSISEEIVIAAAENSRSAVMALLLKRRGDEVKITESVLEAAAGNSGSDAVLALLLKERRDEIEVTEKVAIAAVNNPATLALLLDEMESKVPITDTVIRAALRREEIMGVLPLLLEHGRGVEITDELIRASAWRPEAMVMLLERGRNQITDEVVQAAVRSREAIEMLLKTRGDEVKITEEALKVAVRFPEALPVIFENKGADIHITTNVLRAAAHKKNALAFLLDHYGKELEITPEVVVDATWDGDCLELLLERRGEDVKITQDVIKIALRNPNSMAVLLEKRANEVSITPDVVKCAARKERAFTVLLDTRGDEVTITPEVAEIAAETSAVMKVLLEKRGDEVELNETIVKRALRMRRLKAVLLEKRADEFNRIIASM